MDDALLAGDCGDVIPSLWPTIIDRVVADATESVLNVLGSVTGMGDIGTMQREFGDWLDTAFSDITNGR